MCMHTYMCFVCFYLFVCVHVCAGGHMRMRCECVVYSTLSIVCMCMYVCMCMHVVHNL